MPTESFEPPRWNALPGLSTSSVTSVEVGTRTTANVSEEESARVLADRLCLYVEHFGVVTQSERGFEIGVTAPGDSRTTTPLHHGVPATLSDEHLDHVPHAGAASVVGQSRTRNTNNSLIGVSGFDSSAGRPPRCPEVSGPGRLAHGLPLEVNDVRR